MVVDDKTSCTESFLLLDISGVEWLLSSRKGWREDGAGRLGGGERCFWTRGGILTGSENGVYESEVCCNRLWERADRVGEPEFLIGDLLLDRTSFSSKLIVWLWPIDAGTKARGTIIIAVRDLNLYNSNLVQ